MKKPWIVWLNLQMFERVDVMTCYCQFDMEVNVTKSENPRRFLATQLKNSSFWCIFDWKQSPTLLWCLANAQWTHLSLFVGITKWNQTKPIPNEESDKHRKPRKSQQLTSRWWWMQTNMKSNSNQSKFKWMKWYEIKLTYKWRMHKHARKSFQHVDIFGIE